MDVGNELWGRDLVPAGGHLATSSQPLRSHLGEELFSAGPAVAAELTRGLGTEVSAQSRFVGPLQLASVTSTGDATEGGGAGYFRVSRATNTGSLQVFYRVMKGSSSVSPFDYAPMLGSVTIEDGQYSADIGVFPTDDVIPEDPETLSLVLLGTDSVQYTVDPAARQLQIWDNDAASQLPVVSIVATSDASEEGAPGIVELQRFGAVDSAMSVVLTIDVVQSTATFGTDLASHDTEIPVTFPAGQSVVSWSFLVDDDAEYEGYEWVSIAVAASGDGSYLADRSASVYVNVVDNDQPEEPPVISQLAASGPSGVSAADQAASDRRVTGVAFTQIVDEPLRVEFDHGADGSVDGVETVRSGQPFVYDPVSFEPTVVDRAGPWELRARAVRLGTDGTTEIQGPWTSFVAQWQQPAESGTPRLADIGLVRDTGVRGDGFTINPTLTGKVLGDLAGGSAHVEFDHDGDIIARLRQCKEAINHVHTAGNPGRAELDDQQEINYGPVMKALLDIGYTGFVGHEFIPTRDPLAGLRQAVRVCDA